VWGINKQELLVREPPYGKAANFFQHTGDTGILPSLTTSSSANWHRTNARDFLTPSSDERDQMNLPQVAAIHILSPLLQLPATLF
jgi:hypothetical protein